MQALYSVMPELVPRPVGMGSYSAAEHIDKWFFLCEYKEMRDEAPEKEDLAPKIAELHERGVSPDGKFGFPVETYGGRLPMIYPVCDTWEELFTKVLNTTFDVEEEVQGVDEDMQMLRKAIMEKVVPRLLRPLETGDRKLIPVSNSLPFSLTHPAVSTSNIDILQK